MSVQVRVSVNGDPIYWVVAVRTTNVNVETTDPDSLNTYAVHRIWNDPDKPDSDHRQIIHRYGDGLTSLARKMVKGLRDAQ